MPATSSKVHDSPIPDVNTHVRKADPTHMLHAILQLRTWLAERGDRGASLVEYALLLALIAMVCLVAVNTIGEPTSTGLSNVGDGFP